MYATPIIVHKSVRMVKVQRRIKPVFLHGQLNHMGVSEDVQLPPKKQDKQFCGSGDN